MTSLRMFGVEKRAISRKMSCAPNGREEREERERGASER
jgi:hypothetical protein